MWKTYLSREDNGYGHKEWVVALARGRYIINEWATYNLFRAIKQYIKATVYALAQNLEEV